MNPLAKENFPFEVTTEWFCRAFTNSYGNPHLTPEAKAWLEENGIIHFPPSYFVANEKGEPAGEYELGSEFRWSIWFRTERDAVMFKLRWC